MARNFYNKLRSRLSALYGLSIYGALLLVVFGGLVIPAIIGSYLLIGVHEHAVSLKQRVSTRPIRRPNWPSRAPPRIPASAARP